jgi:uncharacterized protein
MPTAVAYEITRAAFDHFDDFRRLHPAFEALSVAGTAHAAGRAPLHAGAARYREHGGCRDGAPVLPTGPSRA